jgi:hypothetical protein
LPGGIGYLLGSYAEFQNSLHLVLPAQASPGAQKQLPVLADFAGILCEALTTIPANVADLSVRVRAAIARGDRKEALSLLHALVLFEREQAAELTPTTAEALVGVATGAAEDRDLVAVALYEEVETSYHLIAEQIRNTALERCQRPPERTTAPALAKALGLEPECLLRAGA